MYNKGHNSLDLNNHIYIYLTSHINQRVANQRERGNQQSPSRSVLKKKIDHKPQHITMKMNYDMEESKFCHHYRHIR